MAYTNNPPTSGMDDQMKSAKSAINKLRGIAEAFRLFGLHAQHQTMDKELANIESCFNACERKLREVDEQPQQEGE